MKAKTSFLVILILVVLGTLLAAEQGDVENPTEVGKISRLLCEGQIYTFHHEPFTITAKLISKPAISQQASKLRDGRTFKYFAARVTIYYPRDWDIVGINHDYLGLDTAVSSAYNGTNQPVPPGHAFEVTTKLPDGVFETWEVKLDNTLEFVANNQRFRIYPDNPITWAPLSIEASSN